MKLRYWLRAVAGAFTAYFFVVMYHYFRFWGLGAAIAAVALIAILAGLGVLVSLLLAHKRQVYEILRRTVVRLSQTAFGRRLEGCMRRRLPGLYRWIRDTVNLETMPGIAMTLGITLSLIFLLLFVGTAFDVVFNRDLALADVRMIYFFRSVVSPGARSFFIFFTHLGDAVTVLVVFAATALYLLLLNQYRWITYMALSVFSGYSAAYITKWIIGRQRPLGINLIDMPSGGSFPSGHAIIAVCLYGFIAYLLFRKFKHILARSIIIVTLLTVIVLIALSRAYLGVHYVSDVLGGLYLGASMLALIITFFEIEYRFHFPGLIRVKNYRYSKKFQASYLAVFLVSIGLVISWQYFRTEVVHSQEVTQKIASVDEFLAQAPHFSEDLLGRRTEPIGFIVIGSREAVRAAFALAGWREAEVPYFINFIKQISSVAKDVPNVTGPMTPAFYNGHTNDLGLQKSTPANTARERHHTRYWDTGYRIDDRQVWVATASLDQGIAIGTVIKFPTHRINPFIDHEREFVFSELMRTGMVMRHEKINLVGYVEGANAAGHPFVTEGWAYVLYLK